MAPVITEMKEREREREVSSEHEWRVRGAERTDQVTWAWVKRRRVVNYNLCMGVNLCSWITLKRESKVTEWLFNRETHSDYFSFTQLYFSGTFCTRKLCTLQLHFRLDCTVSTEALLFSRLFSSLLSPALQSLCSWVRKFTHNFSFYSLLSPLSVSVSLPLIHQTHLFLRDREEEITQQKASQWRVSWLNASAWQMASKQKEQASTHHLSYTFKVVNSCGAWVECISISCPLFVRLLLVHPSSLSLSLSLSPALVSFALVDAQLTFESLTQRAHTNCKRAMNCLALNGRVILQYNCSRHTIFYW